MTTVIPLLRCSLPQLLLCWFLLACQHALAQDGRGDEATATHAPVACADAPSVPALIQEQERVSRRIAEIAQDLDANRGFSREERNEMAREQRKLDARQQLLHEQRSAAERGQCLPDVLPEAVARAAAQQLTLQIDAIKTKAASIRLTAPLALTLTFAISSVGLGLATIIKSAVDASTNDGADDDVIAHDRRVNRALGISVAPLLAGTLAGGIWLGVRHREKRTIMRRIVPLQEQRRRIETMFTPEFGPTHAGLSLGVRF